MKPGSVCDPDGAVEQRTRSGSRPLTSYPITATIHGIDPEITDVRVTSFRINPHCPRAGLVGAIGTFTCDIAGLIVLRGCTLHRGLDGIRVTPPRGHGVLFINGTLRNRLARRAHAAFKIAASQQTSALNPQAGTVES